MMKVAMTIGVAGTLVFALSSAPASAGISAELANKCRTMMIKAHPVEVFGAQGSAAAQRSYFAECVSRNGDTADNANARNGEPAAPSRSTTGSEH